MADATQQLNSEYEAMEILSVLVLSCALWAVDAYPYYPYYGNMDSCKFFLSLEFGGYLGYEVEGKY